MLNNQLNQKFITSWNTLRSGKRVFVGIGGKYRRVHTGREVREGNGLGLQASNAYQAYDKHKGLFQARLGYTENRKLGIRANPIHP